jgi:hypothetical protein
MRSALVQLLDGATLTNSPSHPDISLWRTPAGRTVNRKVVDALTTRRLVRAQAGVAVLTVAGRRQVQAPA